MTFPFFGAYNATKYAVESLSDALGIEVASARIEVVLIEPGVIRTEFADRSMATLSRYRDPSSPYAWVLARADEMKAQTDSMAVGPEVIARVIDRAIQARRPRARYVAPARTSFVLVLKVLLPTRVMDAILRSSMGLTRRRRLAAAGRAELPVGATPLLDQPKAP
jgi:NAD(P)-dependent dehydrogenase (short-subunit alcohol dehydrogenase family)